MNRISLTEFKALDPADILTGPCFEVTFEGRVFTVVVGAQMGMIARVQGLCSQLDASKGNPRMPVPPVEEVESLPGLVYAGIGGSSVFEADSEVATPDAR